MEASELTIAAQEQDFRDMIESFRQTSSQQCVVAGEANLKVRIIRKGKES